MADAAQPGATPAIFNFDAIVRNAFRGEIYLGAGVLFILAILLVPLPAWFMDLPDSQRLANPRTSSCGSSPP